MIEDMYKIKMPGDVQVSDSGIVAFVVGNMRKRDDRYVSSIYIHDGKKLKKFTSGPGDTAPRFYKDEYLIYLRRVKDKVQIRKISLSGGESTLIAEKENISSIKVSGEHVYFISSEKDKSKDDVKRITRIPFYFNGEGFIHDKSMQIYRVKVDGGKIEKLTDEKDPILDYDVQGDKVVYSVADDDTEPFMAHLKLIDEEQTKIITNKKADIMNFSIAPDGSKIAVFLKFNKRGFAEDSQLYILPIHGGDYELACPKKFSFGRSLNSDSRFGGGRTMQWLNENELLFIATVRGRQSIFVYSQGDCWEFLGGERSIEAFHYNAGTLAFVEQRINRPGEVYIKKNTERRITKFNRRFEKLPEPEKFVFKASDGAEIEGWILMPEGNGKHPAVLEIHGGPKTSYGYAFMFEFYYLLSQGFAVIFTNPRGSSGYGEDFALQVRGNFGGRDYKDLMETVDFVVKNYEIDRERLYVTGGSYGGFMTNWIVGHTDIFRAAVTQRSISNQLSFWGTSDIGPWFNSDYVGAGKDIWSATEDYWNMSPLKYAKKIKTPLLIIHSEEDYRCPVSEAYQLFYALKMNGVETKLVLFPNENHDLSRSGKPKHREIRLKEIAEWFNAH